jgi:hypothetical protein
MVCSSWAGGPSCRAGLPTVTLPSATGDLFVLVTGLLDTPYSLDVSPLRVLAAGEQVAGSVDIVETYYKVDGLTPSTSTTVGTFTATLGDGALPLDIFADMFVYDGPQGPFGAALLCSTVAPLHGNSAAAITVPKSCAGITPASGAVYVSVEGWLTAGLDFGTGLLTGERTSP